MGHAPRITWRDPCDLTQWQIWYCQYWLCHCVAWVIYYVTWIIWHDSSIWVACHLLLSALTVIIVWHNSMIWLRGMTHGLCDMPHAEWLIHMSDVTWLIWHVSCIWVTWHLMLSARTLICRVRWHDSCITQHDSCDMAHPYEWCVMTPVTCLVHMSDVFHAYAWRDIYCSQRLKKGLGLPSMCVAVA